jgi:DeoR/GlpR family transcriptional regulator of sugar metabolism
VHIKDDRYSSERTPSGAAPDQLPGDSRQARQIARRRLMVETIMAEGSVRIEEIVERFGISLMTAHRDLDELANRGFLRKTRGVVSSAPTNLNKSGGAYRASHQCPEKRAIAEAAAQFLESGQAIFFDGSTTILQLVPHISVRAPLTAITNSITLVNELKGVRDITLLGLGGRYCNWCNGFIGPVTVSEIRQLRADSVFMSLSAITDGKVFHQSSEMVETKRAMFESAATRILLVDHTKFERRALHAMGSLYDFDIVVVDDRTPAPQIERMKEHGVQVVVASAATSDREQLLRQEVAS